MEITTTSTRPFERIALDIVGPLTTSNSGNRHILTMQDDLTKFTIAVPIPNHEAETISRAFTARCVCIFGIPESILTDQGAEFMSALFKGVAKLFRMKRIQTTAYHPQTNGALERTHLTMADFLKHFVNKDQTNWDEYVDHFMFSYNTTTHSSTNHTPHELLFGYKATLPSSITKPPEFRYTYDDYLVDLTQKMRVTRGIARNAIIESKRKNKNYYDKRARSSRYKVGEEIYLKVEHIPKGKSKKLHSRYAGPYKILEAIPPSHIVIDRNRKRDQIHLDRAKLAN